MTDFQEKSNLKIVKEIEVPRFRHFRGRIIDTIPLVLSGVDNKGEVVDVQRAPMTPAQLLDYRVNGANANDRDLLRNNYTDVAFAEIVDPNGSGEIKYVIYSQPLAQGLINSLNPNSDVRNGSLFVTPEQYNEIPVADSFVVPADVANALREDGYSNPNVRRGIWNYAVEGKEDLVDGNLELVQQRVGGDFSNRMGVFPSRQSGLRSWYVNGLDDRSNAYGNVDLHNGNALVVGVAPEAQNAPQNLDLSSRVANGFSREQIGRFLREEVGYTDSKTIELLEKLGTYQ